MSNNGILPFVLFIALSLVTVLQLVGFGYLFDTLCASVPDGRPYCNKTLNGNSTSSEQDAYTAYEVLTGSSTLLEFLALCVMLSRVFCCVENVCVPFFYDCWQICFAFGNGWIVLLIIGLIICFIGQIVIGAGLPVGDVAPYIRGFRFNLCSLLLGVATVICWFIYVYKYGGPREGYFLGSDKVLSDYEVRSKQETVQERVVDEDGNVTYEDRVKTKRWLVLKDNPNRVHPQ